MNWLSLKKIHSLEIHEDHKDLKCEFCGNSFSEEGTLEKHIHKIHEARKYHNCKCCDNFFSEGGKLKKHIQKVHDNEKMNVAKSLQITKLNCDICKIEISSNKEIYRKRFHSKSRKSLK